MAGHEPLTALGLMSGTSLDGIDAAILRTDGERVLCVGAAATVAYDDAFRERLRGVLGDGRATAGETAAVARALTLKHAPAVESLLAKSRAGDPEFPPVDLIGFHGHTIVHRPEEGVTRQIGDGALLARTTGISVVDDFRSRDLAHGGEGAPLAPLYHGALARELERPVAVLNIGGVANVTWIGAGDDILAFDTGPGNALIDDWVRAATGRPMDLGGRLARSGRARGDVVAALLDHPYFRRPPPKSLDRGDFAADAVSHLSPADGAATLTAFTAGAVAAARAFLPAAPLRWLVCGGGRRNRALMAALEDALETAVEPVETVGWLGDALEAQAFAFLAVRSLYGLPLSLPATTGVARPMGGGTLHKAPGRV